MVIENHTVKIDKDWWQTYKTFSLLLSAIGGGNYSLTVMGQHYEEDKLSLPCHWIKNEEKQW